MLSNVLVTIDRCLKRLGREDAITIRIVSALVLVTFFGFLRASLGLDVLPYLFFVPAIMLGSVLFGMLSGLIAVFASTCAAVYFFMPPFHSFLVATFEQGVGVALFALVMSIIALVCNLLRRTVLAYHGLNTTLEERIRAEIARTSKIEQQLSQASKMDAIGSLAGGISHDMNNMLSAIHSSIGMASSAAAARDCERVQRYIDIAEGAVDRMAALTNRLLAFSRKQTIAHETFDPNPVALGMLDMLRRTMPRHSVTMTIASSPWTVFTDKGQLENVILNLCLNARDAMVDGGAIRVSVENSVLDENSADEWGLAPGDYVVVTCADTGIGMDEATVSRVFEPFFTTKPLGHGTGLGGSMVWAFARDASGSVRVTSAVGVGTTVRVILPRSAGCQGIGESPRPVFAGKANGETILFVDDEPIIRMLSEEHLMESGYVVLTADSGLAAMSVLDKTSVDLIITDVLMPGMNGREMIKRARAIRPGVPVIFITGFAAESVLDTATFDQSMAVMTKPFSLSELTNRVAEMLARPNKGPAQKSCFGPIP